jgi:hypothetical protein
VTLILANAAHVAHPRAVGARTGQSWASAGVRSLEALVDGETDPDHLLMLIDRCVQAPRSAARAAQSMNCIGSGRSMP